MAIDKWLDDEQHGSAGLRARKQRLASLAGVWSRHEAKDEVDVRKLRKGWSRRTRG